MNYIAQSRNLFARINAIETAVMADEAQYAAYLASMRGSQWYVNPATGLDTRSGGSWADAFKTMEAAIDVASVGDQIYFTGTISEDSLTLATAGVRIIGSGLAVWENATADKTLLNIAAPFCSLQTFKIRPPAYTAGAPKGIAISGASYLQLLGLRFQGRAASYDALFSDVSSDNVLIQGCQFLYMNTAANGYAIHGVPAAGGNTHAGWIIDDCYFTGNVNNYVAPSKSCLIQRCTMPDYVLGPAGSAIQTTKKIDVTGTNAGFNQIHNNILGGGALSHAAGYWGVAVNDNWSGNIVDSGAFSASTPPTS